MRVERVTRCSATQVDVFNQSCLDMKKEETSPPAKELIRKTSHLKNHSQSLPLTEDQIKQALQQSIMIPKCSSFFCLPSSIFQRQKKKGFNVKDFSSEFIFHVCVMPHFILNLMLTN